LKAAAERAPASAAGAPGGKTEAAEGAGGTAAPVTLADALKRIPELEKERDAARNDALLSRADLDNYQKRIRREMDDVRTYAAQSVLGELLTALDNIEFSLAAAKVKPDFDQLVLGGEMVLAQLEKILADRGAVRVPTDRVPFDPRRHEAILSEERADVPDGTVVQELRRGYSMKDRVVRAAQVKVSRAPSGGG
jgi:molecular chaperone GrpE